MYSAEIRLKAVIHYLHFSPSLRTVSALYSIKKSSLGRWVQRERSRVQYQSSKPLMESTAKQRSCKYRAISSCLTSMLSERPYSKVLDMQRHVLASCGTRPSRATIYRSLRASSITHKRSQRSRTTSELKPHPFFDLDRPYEGSISIDECHFQESDSPNYGWSKRGERVHRRKPDQYSKHR